jgi:hypothetical protein
MKDWLSVPTREVETDALKRHRRGFISVRSPLSEFHVAAGLPGKCLAVWLLVQHRVRLTHKDEVTLPTALLEAAGIERRAKARALRDLERAGLIRVIRKVGQTPRIFW